VRPIRLRVGGRTEDVRLETDAEAVIGQRRVAYARSGDRITVGATSHRVVTARDGNRVFVWCDGAAHAFEIASSARTAAAADPGADLLAPMPGRVRRVLVAAGQPVARGAVLLALEAMKMEHAIRAPRDGVVRRLLVTEGDLVDAGAELVELEPAAS
jgi:3-methylcrotonyl-CoA carboxylase alpha subunit